MPGSRSAQTCVPLGLLALTSCSTQGAPSFVAFGAYFPGWMVCGAAGVVAVIAMRVILILTGLYQSVPLQLGICISAGVIAASLIWFIWFGR
jgi:YtcA family